MPSVEMRRTTRVFGVRVLRSGRRVFTIQEEVKHMRRPPLAVAEDWIQLLDHHVDCKENMRHNSIEENGEQHKLRASQKSGYNHENCDSLKRWGVVYSRKRKRIDMDFEHCNRYGKKFSRKKIKKKIRGNKNLGKYVLCEKGLVAFVDPCCSYSSRYFFSCFLNSVLRYMRRTRVFSWRKLASFLLLEPIASVYSSLGIRFLQDSICTASSGFCKISGYGHSIPIFALNFSSVPFCFFYMHSSLLLKSALAAYVLVIYPMGMDPANEIFTDDDDDDMEELPSILTCVSDESLIQPVKAKSGRKKAARVSRRNMPLSNGVCTRSSIQKRRSSMRSRKQRSQTLKSNPVISRSIRRANVKEVKIPLAGLTQKGIDSSGICNSNILVIESDRCYREGGAIVTMEMSAPQQWFLVVKRNGIERFRLASQNVMRPCFCNRVTRAIIWAAGDDSWKLEFPTRQDWFVFKQLYRKCSEKYVQNPPVLSIIPVPRVSEVPGYDEDKTLPFRLPDSYIVMTGDEVSRALGKSDSIYDLDSDDEEWLKEFNNERVIKCVSEDNFEKIIDGFERGIYCFPDEYSNATSAIDRCRGLAPEDVLEAVHNYWMAKREKKCSALVRVFQFYQPKRGEQLSFKAVLRKKRSFKRQAARGKQLTFLKAIINGENPVAIKVEESEAAARRSEQTAIVKRQRAQRLMEMADLVTYKATMALTIAQAHSDAAHCGE